MSEEKQPKIRFKGFDDPWEQRKISELAKIQGGRDPRFYKFKILEWRYKLVYAHRSFKSRISF